MGFGTINSGGGKPQDLSGYLKTELLGKAGGVAPLDAQAKIILDYLYTNAANALAKLDANGKLPTDLIPTLSAYIAATAKGAANGVASLDATGKLPSGQLTAHSHAYSDITGKPSTFPPSSHGHVVDDISGVLPVSKGGTGVSSMSALATALGSTKFECGSYVGTGTYGSGNPNSLTFSFEPILVIVSDPDYYATAIFVRNAPGTGYKMAIGTSSYDVCLVTTWSGKTLTWYCSSPSSGQQAYIAQMNSNTVNYKDKYYYYVAMG